MSCATNMPQQVYIHIVHNGPWIGNIENNISSRKYAIMTRIYLLFRFNIDGKEAILFYLRKLRPNNSVHFSNPNWRRPVILVFFIQNHDQRRWMRRRGNMWMDVQFFGKETSLAKINLVKKEIKIKVWDGKKWIDWIHKSGHWKGTSPRKYAVN